MPELPPGPETTTRQDRYTIGTRQDRYTIGTRQDRYTIGTRQAMGTLQFPKSDGQHVMGTGHGQRAYESRAGVLLVAGHAHA